ncbi:MAG TPA: nodulation protein NfeD [Candidatus Atribacteria bacterium]|nr:nodulation protein NfeD [Candidatus Atribacteria bacterium]
MKRKNLKIILLLLLVVAILSWNSFVAAQEKVVIGKLEGVINPVTEQFVVRLIEEGEKEEAQAILILLDTPGGLEESMRNIVKAILQSPLPVITYVYPPGSRAASAGSFIVMASHHAFMSPNTTIGAAHPVTIEGQEVGEKIVNDSASFIKTLAETRGRNPEIAEKMVRESLSLTEKEAQEKGVIDGIAESPEEVIEKLGIKNPHILEVEMKGKEKFLHFLLDPTLAYLFLVIGALGIIFELSNPGAIIPGVFGTILILLAFYALSVFPINLTGILFIFLGLLLFILDILVTPGIGILTAGGAVALFFGSLMLFDVQGGITLPLNIIITTVICVTVFFAFALGMALRAMKKKVVTGKESLIGQTGIAKEDLNPEGFIIVEGELWWSKAENPVKKGEKVVVSQKEGQTLIVKKEE